MAAPPLFQRFQKAGQTVKMPKIQKVKRIYQLNKHSDQKIIFKIPENKQIKVEK